MDYTDRRAWPWRMLPSDAELVKLKQWANCARRASGPETRLLYTFVFHQEFIMRVLDERIGRGLGLKGHSSSGRALCLTLLAGSLAACGGSGDGSASRGLASDAAVTINGRVYPAREGLVLVEYGADGSELQRSTSSAPDGGFQFSKRLSGVRVEALYAASSSRVKPVYSTRLANSATATQLEITPLTTWYDQLVVNGVSRSGAVAYIRGLVNGSCPALQGGLLTKYMYASASVPASDHDWLLDAADAYLQAARAVGIGPKLDFVGWSDTLSRNGALLSQLCAFSSSISTPAWAMAQADRLKQDGKIDKVDDDRLASAIAGARVQGLAVVARQIQQTEYPDQTAELRAVNIAGRELELGSDFVLAQYLQTEVTAKIQDVVGLPTTTGVAITYAGNLVKTMQAGATGDGALAAMRLSNQSGVDKMVHLVLNGQEMGNLSWVIGQILAMPVAYAGEPLYRKAWRYVIAHRRDTQPLAISFFQFQPDLWLRSVGSSYCEAQASVLYRIWTAMGYQAHVYALSGHVTVEIHIDGRWMVFDPFLGVYYTDRQGNIVGVAELEQDPTLVTNPQTPLVPLSAAAYTQNVASIFASADDNVVTSYYTGDEPDPMDETMAIPAGGYLEINSRTDVILESSEPGYQVAMSTMKLWVPPGYIGTIRLPLLLLDVKGAGNIQLFGRTVDASGNIVQNRGMAGLGAMDTSATDSRIHDLLQYFYFHDTSEIGVTEIKINSSGPDGLTLTLLVNPLYFHSQSQLSVRAYGPDIDGLKFVAPPAQ